jgi:molybdopterin/thiamine biosynthesis adenylyltransferase
MLDDGRFDRHLRLPGWDQARLRAATIIVVGVGALGNAVAQALGLAGVGRLLLCDMDRIDASNLSRAPLFTGADVGRLKVEAARDGLARIAPDTVVDIRADRLEHGIGLAELRAASLVMGCLDSRAARLALAGRRGLAGAPWIDGATGPWSGEVRPYLAPEGPCCGCGLTPGERAADDALAQVRRGCGLPAEPDSAGATAPLSALVGNLMALLALRHVMGLDVPPDLLELDGATGRSVPVRQRRDPHCPYHHRLPAARPLSLGPDPSVGDLCAALPADAVPLAWTPFQLALACRRCGFRAERPGRVAAADCPRCGARLHPRTSLELNRAPQGAKLRTLGVPAAEILAVRRPAGLDYIELC